MSSFQKGARKRGSRRHTHPLHKEKVPRLGEKKSDLLSREDRPKLEREGEKDVTRGGDFRNKKENKFPDEKKGKGPPASPKRHLFYLLPGRKRDKVGVPAKGKALRGGSINPRSKNPPWKGKEKGVSHKQV